MTFNVFEAFNHKSAIPPAVRFVVPEYFGYFGNFYFFCAPFLPSFQERDSLKKQKIHEEQTNKQRAREFQAHE